MTIDLKMNSTSDTTSAASGFVRDANPVSPTKVEEKNTDKLSTDKLSTDKFSKVEDDKKTLVNSKLSEDADSEKKVEKAVSDINSSIQSVQRNLQFSVDKDLDKIVINVTDKETDKVVRQIPSEDVLDLARKLQEMVENQASESNSSTKSMLFNSIA